MRRLLPALFTLFISSQAFAAEYFWDFLRPELELAEAFELQIKLLVLILSLAIFGISVLAYSKSKSKRILLVSLAFLLFALKWAVKIVDIYYSPGKFLSDAAENVFELGILLSLLIALFYRKSWNRLFEKQS